MSSEKELRDGWAGWLCERPWTWWGTFTFKSTVSLGYATTCWREWVRYVEERIAPSGVRPGGRVRWARVTEQQRRGALHFHALLDGPMLDHEDPKEAGRAWARIAHGSYAQIVEALDLAERAAYMVKHVPRAGTIDVGGPWKPKPIARDYNKG